MEKSKGSCLSSEYDACDGCQAGRYRSAHEGEAAVALYIIGFISKYTAVQLAVYKITGQIAAAAAAAALALCRSSE